jgi:hypothetical protein
MLFGRMGHAAGGYGGGGGIGFLDVILIGLLLYFGWKFFKKRRAQNAVATGYYTDGGSPRSDGYSGFSHTGSQYADSQYASGSSQVFAPGYGDAGRGIDQIRRFDPNFSEEWFRDTAQNLFFRT